MGACDENAGWGKRGLWGGTGRSKATAGASRSVDERGEGTRSARGDAAIGCAFDRTCMRSISSRFFISDSMSSRCSGSKPSIEMPEGGLGGGGGRAGAGAGCGAASIAPAPCDFRRQTCGTLLGEKGSTLACGGTHLEGFELLDRLSHPREFVLLRLQAREHVAQIGLVLGHAWWKETRGTRHPRRRKQEGPGVSWRHSAR